MSSEPKAMSSAVPQSMPPLATESARFSSIWRSLGCTVKPSGVATKALPMCMSVSCEMAVSTNLAGALSSASCASGRSSPDGPLSWPDRAALMASRVSTNTRSSCCW